MPNQAGELTWADVKTTIAYRLNRPSLPPPFIQMIADEQAEVLSSEGWWPQEQTNNDITTEPGQYFYTLPKGTIQIVFIRFLLTQVYIPVYMARSYEDILLSDPVAPPFTAIPSTARIFGRSLRLFPTPNGQYPLELSLIQKVPIPSNDQDTTSFWVNEGRTLIVNLVCQHIAQELLRDPDRAALHEKAVEKAMDSIAEISHARNSPHVMRRN